MADKRIFWSYKSDERDFAQRIVTDLRRAGFDIWWDKDGIQGGDDWQFILQQVLDDPRTVGLIAQISPKYTDSPWCMRELRRADGNVHTRIIPVLHKPVASMPMPVQDLHYIDFLDDAAYATRLAELMGVLRNIPGVEGDASLPPTAPDLPRPGPHMPDQDINHLTEVRLKKQLEALAEEHQEEYKQWERSSGQSRVHAARGLSGLEDSIWKIGKQLGLANNEIETYLK